MTRNCDSMIRCLWFHDITPLHTADFHPPLHVSPFQFHTYCHTPYALLPATYFHCIFCYFSKLAALISFLHPSHLSPHLSPHTPDWSHSVWHKIIWRGCLQCLEIMTWCNLSQRMLWAHQCDPPCLPFTFCPCCFICKCLHPAHAGLWRLYECPK